MRSGVLAPLLIRYLCGVDEIGIRERLALAWCVSTIGVRHPYPAPLTAYHNNKNVEFVKP